VAFDEDELVRVLQGEPPDPSAELQELLLVRAGGARGRAQPCTTMRGFAEMALGYGYLGDRGGV